MATPVRIGMSITDFMQQFEEQPFELINGEIIPVPPSALGPIYIANKLSKLIDRYAADIGETLVEATFVLTDSPDWVTGSRIPDMVYLQAKKFASYKAAHPNWQTEPMRLIPDIAVEVMSPNDTFSKTRDKALLYLQDGVPLVWVIDPERRVIYSFTPENQQGIPLTEGDKLTAGSIIPNLEIEIAVLFT